MRLKLIKWKIPWEWPANQWHYRACYQYLEDMGAEIYWATGGAESYWLVKWPEK